MPSPMDITSKDIPIPNDPGNMIQVRAMLAAINSLFVGIGTFIIRETPSGSVDGSNTAFGLAHIPLAGSEQWFINGIMQKPGVDYSISGVTITAIKIPETGDWVCVNYRY